jgi:hypothetical protein
MSTGYAPTCRSRLAGEGVGSVDIIVAEPSPSRASSLLQFLRRPQRARRQDMHRPVGAGLLAKASARSISTSLSHRHREQAHSYSFASSSTRPPTGFAPTCRSRLAGESRSQRVGARLPAKNRTPARDVVTGPAIRQQAGSYRGPGCRSKCNPLVGPALAGKLLQ